ncbi:peptide chain release factor N(5)-glutamine methyltransferase [Roseobacteraceae bacterium S113]
MMDKDIYTIQAATQALTRAGISGAHGEARKIWAAVFPPDYVDGGEFGDAVRHRHFDAMVKRRMRREPMSHILGKRAFYEHDFYVDARVLDPRPDTEALVIHALTQPWSRLLDLGTGSGAIAVSLLAARTAAQGVGSDLSAEALEVARRNADQIGVADRLELVQSDWFAQIQGRFDLIVSNPPYIALGEMSGLAPELAYEPRMALTDEGDGLMAYRNIAAGVVAHLRPGGHVMVEIGPTQAGAVSGLFQKAGLVGITVIPDLDGRDRVVSARAP